MVFIDQTKLNFNWFWNINLMFLLTWRQLILNLRTVSEVEAVNQLKLRSLYQKMLYITTSYFVHEMAMKKWVLHESAHEISFMHNYVCMKYAWRKVKSRYCMNVAWNNTRKSVWIICIYEKSIKIGFHVLLYKYPHFWNYHVITTSLILFYIWKLC